MAVGNHDEGQSQDAEWTVYTPDVRSRLTTLQALRSIVRDIYQWRSLLWQIFVKDFRAQYQQSVLGTLWSVILPIVPVFVYVFMNLVGVLRPGSKIPFLLFAAVGLTVWKVFAEGISKSISKVLTSKSILTKIRAPKIVVIISGFMSVGFDTLVRLGLVAVLVFIVGVKPSIFGCLLFIGALVPLFSLTMAVGLIASILNVVVRDVQKIVQVALTYGLFFSSVIFVIPEGGIMGKIVQFNPMNTYVDGMREMLFMGSPSKQWLFLVTCLVSLVCLIIAIKVFYMLEYVVDDKL
ncbi:ABC transporter permease [Thermodesulfobacteriota bacterium]